MSDATPSASIIAGALREVVVTDARGRKIKVRRLNALDRARLFKSIGPAQAANAPYLGMAMIVASATEVDGTPMLFPASDQQIEAAIARFDDDGMDAIATGLNGIMNPKPDNEPSAD